MMPLSLLLTVLLSQPPVDEGLISPWAADYEAAVERAKRSQIWANNNTRARPEDVITRLRETLKVMGEYEEELLGDPESRSLVINLRLNLVRALLTTGNEAEAASIIDDLIRLPLEEPIAVGIFGPTMVELHEARLAAIEAAGHARLEVLCHRACSVIVNDQPVAGQELERALELYLGRYEVEIRATERDLPPATHVVELVAPGRVERLEFGAPPEVVEPPREAPKTPPRFLPRWGEGAGLATGVGLAVVGAVLLSYHGKCTEDRNQPVQACPQVWKSLPGGLTALGVGLGLVVASSVLIGLDETGIRRPRDRRARLTPAGVLRF